VRQPYCDENGVGFGACLAENSTPFWSHHSIPRRDETWLPEWSGKLGGVERCDGLGISGVSLHSYRYAWAERALKCGFPERFAQQALGHNSKAVHRTFAVQPHFSFQLSEFQLLPCHRAAAG